MGPELTTFAAGYVHSSDDGETVTVGFADRRNDPQRFFLLQRDKKATRQEKSLRLDQVHLTVDDEHRSCYGGIRLVELGPRSVRIELSRESARQVGTDEEVVIRFQASDEERADIVARLSDMFSDAS